MGASVLNTLTSLRTDVKNALTANGIKAVEYVQENLVPPVCVVIPASPYITTPEGQNPFGHYSVGIHVLVIGGKATNKTAAENIDSAIVNVLDALDDEWDVTEVTQPMEMTLKNVQYIGAAVTLETNTKIIKEVI